MGTGMSNKIFEGINKPEQEKAYDWKEAIRSKDLEEIMEKLREYALEMIKQNHVLAAEVRKEYRNFSKQKFNNEGEKRAAESDVLWNIKQFNDNLGRDGLDEFMPYVIWSLLKDSRGKIKTDEIMH